MAIHARTEQPTPDTPTSESRHLEADRPPDPGLGSGTYCSRDTPRGRAALAQIAGTALLLALSVPAPAAAEPGAAAPAAFELPDRGHHVEPPAPEASDLERSDPGGSAQGVIVQHHELRPDEPNDVDVRIGAVFASDPDRLSRSQRRAWRATVAIAHRSGGIRGAGGRSHGSGVVLAVNPKTREVAVATASHVVPCRRGCVIRVELPSPSAGSANAATMKARVAWRDREADLALLVAALPECEPMPSSRIAAVPRRRSASARPGSTSDPGGAPRVGESVLALGFPDPEQLPSGREPRKGGDEQAEGKRVSSGRLEVASHALTAPVRSLSSRAPSSRLRAARARLRAPRARLHTAPILPGSSGGPLVDVSGRLLGVHVGFLLRADGSCVAADPGPDGSAALPPSGTRCLHLAVDPGPLYEALERLWPETAGVAARPSALGLTPPSP